MPAELNDGPQDLPHHGPAEQAQESSSPSSQTLFVVVDPLSRQADGEAVRVARDVLSAQRRTKIAIPDDAAELRHMLAHRGRRQPVVIGDDQALHRTVQVLHSRDELSGARLSVIPVGPPARTRLARALGIPTDPAPAARVALGGTERRLDLLVDDEDGVVLDSLRVLPARSRVLRIQHAAGVRRAPRPAAPCAQRGMRVQVCTDDGLVGDPERPVRLLSVDRHPEGGEMEVVLRQPLADSPLRVRARQLRVVGDAFSYQADAELLGPVPSRTWTVLPDAWGVAVPAS